MNERIRQLAEQADVFEYKTYYDPTFSKSVINDDNMQKFAQLIVKECLEACSRANEIRHFVPPTQEQVVLSCIREIETTFRS